MDKRNSRRASEATVGDDGTRRPRPQKRRDEQPKEHRGERRDDQRGERSSSRHVGRPSPRNAGRPAPRSSDRHPDRNRADSGGAGVRNLGPEIPEDVDARQLSPDVRAELRTLDKKTAETVARHLVAAGALLDEDPEAALAHAKAAKSRSARIAAVREAVGIAAYHCGDWAQALSELRAARRMGSRSPLLALIADCERGIGRPERAIELARSAEAKELTGDAADELRIVAAGARTDLGQLEQALALLSAPAPDPGRVGETAARLCYAYADTLLALERKPEAVQWFLRAAEADVDGLTDAEERAAELA